MPPQQWQVYLVANCRHAKPIPKTKFVVLACEDGDWHGFFINSAIRNFILNRPTLHQCEALIAAHEHAFLSRDSYVDCTTIYPFMASELAGFMGILSANAITDVRGAVANCPVLLRHYKSLILK
jgi:hypothetical protein